MCSEFIKSISFMGVSNSEMLLSEKDLNVVEFNNFLVRPPTSLDFQHERHQITCRLQQQEEEDPGVLGQMQEEEKEEEEKIIKRKLEKEEDKFERLVSTLKLKIPSHHHVEEVIGDIADHDHHDDNQENINGHDNCNDGFKTPTSLDNKIPAILPCPPAPRKPKSTISKMKRKANRRLVFLDLSSEIESLFPPNVLADLGGKIKKKVRQGNDNITL